MRISAREYQLSGWPTRYRRQSGPNRGQLDSLTGLRILAAVWVMLLHFRDVTQTRQWKFPLIDSLVLHGLYGVELFFVLSGFILSHVYLEQFKVGVNRSNFRSFIGFRFARLYPVHVVTFLTMIAFFFGEMFITGRSTAPGERYSVPAVVSTLTMTHTWWGAGIRTPNIPAWSISAEWFAYLLFPFLCWIVTRLRFAPLVFFLAGLGLATIWHDDYHLIRVMAGFTVGMAAYQVSRHSSKLTTRMPAMGTVVVILIVLWATLSGPPQPEPGYTGHTLPQWIQAEIGILLFAALILTVASERDWLCRLLSLKAMVYLGEVSYAVYMVHWVVRVVLRAVAERLGILDAIPPGLVVASYVAVTMVAAIVLYHFVERPWRRRLRRMLAPRVVIQPATEQPTSLAGADPGNG